MDWPAGGSRDAGSSPGGRRKAQHAVRAFRLPPGDDGTVCPKAVNLHLTGVMDRSFQTPKDIDHWKRAARRTNRYS